jgi:hypothetical protein
VVMYIPNTLSEEPGPTVIKLKLVFLKKNPTQISESDNFLYLGNILRLCNGWKYSQLPRSHTQIFNVRIVFEILKIYLIEEPKSPSQTNKTIVSLNFENRVGFFSANGLIMVFMRNHFTEYIGTNAYG